MAVTGVFAVAFPKQFAHQLEISLVRQPTPYTQLFFSDPTALTGELKVAQKNGFAFTIINDQGNAHFYRYIVTMSGAGARKVVAMSSMTIANSRSETRVIILKPKSHRSKYLITVSLVGTNQSIHFYGDTS